jgi:hypothetical protein
MDFIEVKSVEEKFYKGKVYDLKIHGEDHTYKINGFTVHNSAGGSLVACCLGITKWSIDPIKNGLLFERFISSERLPDSIIDYYCSDEE